MEYNKYLKKVISVKMRNGFYYQGVLIDVGVKWILLKYIPVDYVVDGYILINTNYLLDIEIFEEDIFTEEILKLKKINLDLKFDFNLDNSEELFLKMKNEDEIIKIELKEHTKSYVGKLTIVREKSMKVHLFNKKCIWMKEEVFLYNELRVIYFKDDYIESLKLYLSPAPDGSNM